MSVRLENLTRGPVLVTLASGDTVRLSPRARSDAIADVEIAGHAQVENLVTAGTIAVHPEALAAPRRRGESRAKSTG